MPVRLIAVDFDGTLLDPTDRVTPRVVEAVARARRAGVHVVPATGRPERLVWDVALEAGLGPLGVCSNGAALIDLDDHRVVSRSGFTGAEALSLVDVLRERVPGVVLAADRGDRFIHEPSFFTGLGLPSRPGRISTADVRDRVGDGCMKFVARRADLSSLELAGRLSPGLVQGAGRPGGAGTIPRHPAGDGRPAGPPALHQANPYPAARYPDGPAEQAGMDRDEPGDLAEVTASDIAWVDIGPAGLSKATGLADVCRRLGIGLEDVAAIGDHFNDLPMLRAAGLAGAMGNGVAEVREVADVVMPSNADDGVAAFIDLVLDRPDTVPAARARR